MKNIIKRSSLIVGLISGLASGVFAQTPVVLFQDGFENGTPGLSPVQPQVGTYLITGTTLGDETNEVQILTGAFPGGPSGAVTGNNYLMINRNDYQTANQILQCFLATSFFATNSPFHVEFSLWADHIPLDNNWPQFVLSQGIAANNTALLYSADVLRSGDWKWYDGAYHNSGLFFSAASWDFVQIDWDGTNMTGTINGTSAPLGIYGSSDKIVDRLLIRTGTAQTQFYVDDVKVTTTAGILLRSIKPGINATSVGRQPTVEVQLADAVQSVATGSIQLYFNDLQITPTVTQTNVNGLNVTVISYVPPVLPYGSTNTVKCLYADQATPANQYSKEWKFTVYSSDTIFADSFESSIPLAVPFHFDTIEGSNCLSISRIGAGRPVVEAAGDTNLTSVTDDLISINLSFGAWKNGATNGVLAVIPGYASSDENGKFTFNQTGQINLTDEGRVSVVDLTGAINQYLTQALNTNAWNTVQIQYVNGSAQWSVSVNGAPAETFFGKSSTGGSSYGNVNGFRLATAGNGTTWCDDFTVSNVTANTLLFKDGFENTSQGEVPGTNSPSVGTYITIDPSTVAGGLFVSEGVNGANYLPAPPNAPQTGDYDTQATTAYVLTGTGHAGTKFADLAQGDMKADFTTLIPSGTKLHAEAWIKWQSGQPSWGFNADGDNQFAKVTLNTDNSITLFNGTNDVGTGFSHTTGAWEKYELDYIVGASDITFKFSGNAVTLPISPRSTVNGLFFLKNGSEAFVDDVRATALLGEIPATDPLLEVTRNGDQLILTWANGAGYRLQSNSDLSNASGWGNVPRGGTSPVQVPVGAATFYRLAKPL
jgi:hypothetical protein